MRRKMTNREKNAALNQARTWIDETATTIGTQAAHDVAAICKKSMRFSSTAAS